LGRSPAGTTPDRADGDGLAPIESWPATDNPQRTASRDSSAGGVSLFPARPYLPRPEEWHVRHADWYERNRLTLTTKRAMDICGSLVLFVLLAPLLIGIAAAIRLTSPGPALFRQPRYGKDNELFLIWKFRTMRPDAQDPSGRVQTVEGDTRVTSIGRFLRRTSLDELPQLINVLKGEMSLVGPRPHVPGMLAGGMLYEELVPSYFQRHRVRPGITGLAQVRGYRGPTTDAGHAKRRVACDLAYIDKLSIGLELRILWDTFVSEFLGGSGI
jgi:polysaccharide biosynthesis protein PslA